jgi:hypothetical protein
MAKINKPHLQKSAIKELLEKKMSVQDIPEQNLVVSFMHLDRNQGATFEEWQADGMLAPALNLLAGYCHGSLPAQQDSKFTIYGNFPPQTDFVHPKHIPEDAKWARFHIDGSHILAGHVIRNVFYAVFLDSKHRFWISKGADN